MILNSSKTRNLQPREKVLINKHGVKYVDRIIRLNICRCRQCEDECKKLSQIPHVLCVHCYNNHTQAVNGKYLGPHE